DELTAMLRELHASGDGGATLPEIKTRLHDVSLNKLRVVAKLLRDAGVVRQERDQRYVLGRADVPRGEIERLAGSYRERAEADREKLERMMFYAQTVSCRWKVILEYFAEADGFERCGCCDNCLRPPAERYAVAQAPESAVRVKRRRMPQFDEGATVRVPRYGEGRVVGSVADQVEIAFPDGRKRTFLSSYVQRPPA
ncbi:MAG TPA: RecQ family zinc-binding domain-containing protein, partial [Burkholderiales bacterium]|nr:RecQ family zinc-binding domain-containing protein [Burkholderiales bacterium]